MYAKTPIVIGETDPEGCAACGVRHYPHNGYRYGTMFPTYTALQLARVYELADRRKVNLLGAVTWAFLFEDQPYFDGFRDLATNGIAKPVLNTFRMLGQMRGDRVEVESSGALSVEQIRDRQVHCDGQRYTVIEPAPRLTQRKLQHSRCQWTHQS